MWDVSNSAFGGFPQGSNGVATAELRDSAAQGDQLTVADAIFPLRPVTALVYSVAPIEQPVPFVLANLGFVPSATLLAAIQAALKAMFLRIGSPLGVTLYPNQWEATLATVTGLPQYTLVSPVGPSLAPLAISQPSARSTQHPDERDVLHRGRVCPGPAKPSADRPSLAARGRRGPAAGREFAGTQLHPAARQGQLPPHRGLSLHCGRTPPRMGILPWAPRPLRRRRSDHRPAAGSRRGPAHAIERADDRSTDRLCRRAGLHNHDPGICACPSG